MTLSLRMCGVSVNTMSTDSFVTNIEAPTVDLSTNIEALPHSMMVMIPVASASLMFDSMKRAY